MNRRARIVAKDGAIRIEIDATGLPHSRERKRWTAAEVRATVNAWIDERRRRTLRVIDGGKKAP